MNNQVGSFIRKPEVFSRVVSNNSCKVILSTETPCQFKNGYPEQIRLKERKSFRFKDWIVYDFTVVWYGKTIKDLTHLPPRYELEIECLADLLNTRDEYLICSTLANAVSNISDLGKSSYLPNIVYPLIPKDMSSTTTIDTRPRLLKEVKQEEPEPEPKKKSKKKKAPKTDNTEAVTKKRKRTPKIIPPLTEKSLLSEFKKINT